MKHALAAVVLACLCAFAGLTPSAQATNASQTSFDSETRGLYITDDSGSGEGESKLLGIWEESGDFVSYLDPFTPFTARDPRTLFGAGQQLPFPFADGASTGVAVDSSFVYRRSAGGEFTVAPLYRDQDAPVDASTLPCPAHLGSAPCNLFARMYDDHGKAIVSSFVPPLFDLTLAVAEGGRFVAATGPERFLTIEDFFSSQALLRLPNGRDAVLFNGFQSGSDFRYALLTPAGREVRILPLGAGSFYSVFNVFVRNGKTYLVASKYAMTGVTSSLSLVDDLGAETPQLTQIVDLTAVTGAMSSFSADRTGIWARANVSGSPLIHVAFADGAHTDFGRCEGASYVLLNPPRSGSETLWVACRTSLLALRDGQIVKTLTIDAVATGGQVLVSDPEDPVLALDFGAGRIGRLTARGLELLEQGYEIAPVVVTTRMWREGGATCGFSIGDQAGKILCRRGMTWTDETATHPKLYDTMRAADGLWGLEMTATEFVAYHLQDSGAWLEVGRIARPAPEPGPFPVQRYARFIAVEGRRTVAIDAPAHDRVILVEGDTWREGYAPGVRIGSGGAGRPVLDGEGYLYSLCFNDPSSPGKASVCRVASDGTSTILPWDDGYTSASSTVFYPLRRGVIGIGSSDAAWVYRGDRAIELGTLYGELRSLPERKLRLSFVPDENGAIWITRELSGDDSEITEERTLFRYDGLSLTEVRRWTPIGDGDGSAAGSSAPSPGNDDYGPEAVMWRNGTGLYHWEGMGGELGRMSPEVIARAAPAPRLNHVSGGARAGDTAWFGTSLGLLRCPVAAGADLDADGDDFPITRGCDWQRRLAPIRAMFELASHIFLLEGRRVVRLDKGDPAADFVISPPMVERLVRDADDAVWLEGGAYVIHGGADADVRRTAAAPADAAPESHRGFGRLYACTNRGVFHRRDESADWEPSAELPRCFGLVADGSAAYVIAGDELIAMVDGQISRRATLPRTANTDVVLGMMRGVPHVAIGTALYAWNAAGIEDVTPRTRGESRLRTALVAIDGRVLALAGGGSFLWEEPMRFFRFE